MRVRLGLVSETTDAFLNQVKLCLYSLRKNAGALRDVPVTLITNNEPIPEKEKNFLEMHFSPIEFKTFPRLGATPHTSKLNVFYGIDPSTYDVLIYMDCDTVVSKSLDCIIDPINNEAAQFVCRRGGETDRNQFLDFDALVTTLCGEKIENKIMFEGSEEWPMFNTGVFLATSEAVRKIRGNSIQFTYWLFTKWQRYDAIEKLPLINSLYRLKVFKTRKKTSDTWSMEQGAIALACIKSGVKVRYLDDIFNTWGPTENFRILHCFKSAYKFDRGSMYSEKSRDWLKEYMNSDLPGKVFLAKIVLEYTHKFRPISE
jgi:hypothetical protein